MPRPLIALLILASSAIFPGLADPVALVQGDDPAQFDRVGLAPESIVIESGEVRLTGKPLGYFATKREYKDYVLTFEYKFDRPEGLKLETDFRGNSGVLLHIAGPAKVWPTSLEVQLAQFDPGAIFAVGEARCEAGSNPVAQKSAIKPVGDWNKVEVTARAGTIVTRLNGAEIARAEKVEPDHGPIAWQSEGQPIRFREIQIKALP